MTDLVVRRLLVDLEAPFPRRWCGGDAFRSALFDALSMSFPVGEQFFIDSVRAGWKSLPPADGERFAADVRAFAGQEATHRRLHGLFNGHLATQGLVNGWAGRAQKRLERLAGTDPRHAVAATAAYEHFTAIMAEWMLANADLLDGADERLKTMWLWHAAEESEHKCVAFDLYRAMGGDERWRLKWFRRVTILFVVDATRQTIDNLRRGGDLWRWPTWTAGASYLFGRRGLVRDAFGPWRAYFRQGFHPSQQDTARSRDWLAAHADRYVPVGAG